MGRTPAAWLSGDGPRASIVLSSRVRLARNVRGVPFGPRASEEDRERVVARARAASRKARGLTGSGFVDVARLTDADRRFLVERHLISRDLASEKGSCGVLVAPDERVSVLVGEEDHLRLQVIESGYQLDAAWRTVDDLDTDLAAGVGYAFSDSLGYLTACPTNVGTGMRASVLVHLPALVLTKQIGKVLQGINQVGLAVRGLHGEGSEVMGNFFQISNQATLGLSEAEIVQNLVRVTQQIIDHEDAAAEVLMRDARAEVEDKVFRSYGILLHCRVISTEEVMSLVSAVRLGVSLGIVGEVDVPVLNRLLVFTQPAHVDRSLRRPPPRPARDQARADLVRALLAPAPSSN
jgi:protein arginine kinase